MLYGPVSGAARSQVSMCVRLTAAADSRASQRDRSREVRAGKPLTPVRVSAAQLES
jgi:hypothetical protein